MLNGDTADFVLLVDSTTAAPATVQRLTGMLYTSPRDTTGVVPTQADDMFHPNYGAGLPTLVDAPQSIDLQDEIITRIVFGMSSDPGVASPTTSSDITVTYPTPSDVYVNIGEFQATSGASQAMPSIALTPTGG
jgi:hypothetical protein